MNCVSLRYKLFSYICVMFTQRGVLIQLGRINQNEEELVRIEIQHISGKL